MEMSITFSNCNIIIVIVNYLLLWLNNDNEQTSAGCFYIGYVQNILYYGIRYIRLLTIYNLVKDKISQKF